MKIESETLILSVETATRESSLAIFRGSRLGACWRGDDDFSASDGLLLEIQKLLRRVKANLNEVDLLTATVGPGSFTGLRVGLAIAKGLAAPWQIPVIGVSTFDALVCQQPPTNSVCAIIPAGRNEFFAQTFCAGQDKNFDSMKIGEIKGLLSELKETNNLQVIAPVETHNGIFEFIEREKLATWTVNSPPENLAVCAGKLGFDLFRQNNLSSQSWQIIYGRDAVASRKNSY